MTHTRRKKDKLSGDVRKLKSDDIMEKVFPKKVVKEHKKVAQVTDNTGQSYFKVNAWVENQ